jgi:hypothetical protein
MDLLALTHISLVFQFFVNVNFSPAISLWDLKYTVLFFIHSICIVFGTTALLCGQLYTVTRGVTTNEAFNRFRYLYLARHQGKSPFSNGFTRNLLEFIGICRGSSFQRGHLVTETVFDPEFTSWASKEREYNANENELILSEWKEYTSASCQAGNCLHVAKNQTHHSELTRTNHQHSLVQLQGILVDKQNKEMNEEMSGESEHSLLLPSKDQTDQNSLANVQLSPLSHSHAFLRDSAAGTAEAEPDCAYVMPIQNVSNKRD